MTKTQYLASLKKLGLSNVGASVLGLSARQCQRIAAGTSPVPKPLEHLINLMIKHDIKPEALQEKK